MKFKTRRHSPSGNDPATWPDQGMHRGNSQNLGARGTPVFPLAARRIFGVLAVVCVAFLAHADDAAAPARNWVLPLYTDEGFHTMTARGSEAHVTTDRRFDVIDFNLTLFTGDASNRVETVILSPAATFLPDAREAHGEKSVRLVRDDLEASGTRWVYWHNQKKISLDGNVRVTFRAELKGLLK